MHTKVTISYRLILFFSAQAVCCFCSAQLTSGVSSFLMSDSVRVTIDQPAVFKKNKETVIVFFALPNGNSTEQTMG